MLEGGTKRLDIGGVPYDFEPAAGAMQRSGANSDKHKRSGNLTVTAQR